MRTRNQLSMTDVLVGIFVLLLITTACMSAALRSRDAANRAKCQSNLHMIGLSILLYQNDNQQSYPRCVADDSQEPKPVWGTPYESNKQIGPVDNASAFDGGKAAPVANDVSASLFLLIRNEQLPASTFICPSSRLEPWDFGGESHNFQQWTNWQGNDGLAKHLTYSYQNPYASLVAISRGFQLKNPDATFAVAADMNPGGDAVTKVTPQSTAEEIHAANSLNHERDGQNVLYGDGHAEFQNNPFCGSMHDNIYSACGPEVVEPGRGKAVIIASPCGPTDSILLPTAADIGYKGRPVAPPLTKDQIARLANEVQGTYTCNYPGRRTATLTLDDKSLKCVMGPVTVLYQYQVTGSDDGGLLVHLTAPQTQTDAVLSLQSGSLDLKLDNKIDFPMDFAWHRVGPMN